MKLYDIRSEITNSSSDDWYVLPTEAPTYVHRFQYGSDQRGDAIWGLDEHYSRAVLIENVDIGLVWGMRMSDHKLEPDWGTNAGSIDGTVSDALVEVLYRGQPVDRAVYAVVDNAHGKMPWPEAHFAPDAMVQDPVPPPESYTVNGWELTLVRLIDELDNGGGYGTPDEYVKRVGATVR